MSPVYIDTTPPISPAASAYYDAALYTLPDRFEAAAFAPIRPRLDPLRSVFTLRQVVLYKWRAVEWRIVTDTRNAKVPIVAYRTQFDNEATLARYVADYNTDPASAALNPALHHWEVRIPERTLDWAMRSLRAVTIPVSPGISPAAPQLFPLCTFEFGAVSSALQASATLRWQNPRRGPWDPLISFFRTFWHRLECHLDGRPPSTTRIPPRDALSFDQCCQLHPLERPAPSTPLARRPRRTTRR